MTDTSEDDLKRQLKKLIETLGEHHPDVAKALENLAALYWSQGLHGQAGPLFERAVAIKEQVFGPDHPDTAATISELAELYKSQGFYSKAEFHFYQALAIYEQALGNNHPETATCLNQLALLYNDQGFYNQAHPLYERALAIREKIFGQDHLETSQSLNNLGTLYLGFGQYTQAEPLLERGLMIRTKNLRPDDPLISTSLNNMACLYVEQGLYGQAEPLLERALNIRIRTLGHDHPNTIQSLCNLASLYSNQGLFGRAESHFKSALNHAEQALGSSHPETIRVLNNLGSMYWDQGILCKSEALYTRALFAVQKHFGLDSPIILTPVINLATVYHTQAQCAKAESLYNHALKISEASIGRDCIVSAVILHNLAGLYMDQALYREAEIYFRHALKILKGHLGRNHIKTITCEYSAGFILLLQKEYQKALPSLEAAVRSHLAWLHREAPLMSATCRRKLLIKYQGADLISFDLIIKNYQFCHLIFFVRLNRHGLLQQIEQCQAQLARLPGLHRPLVERLQAVVSVLASSQLDPDRRRALAEERDQLEAQLYRLLPDLQSKTVEVSDVAAALPSDAALIEFQRYIPHTADDSEADSSPRYVAFILSPEERIEVIDLGPAAPLEAAIEEAIADTVDCFADVAHAWCALSERLLLPLLSQLRECKLWYVSLDGELHRVPFHALPHPEQPDHLLVEAVKLRLVTSGRDLLDHHRNPESSSSVGPGLVVADPSFDQSPKSSSQEPLDIASHQWRSRDMGTLNVWKPLPGTAKEGKQLAELLGVRLRTGAAATTLAVQQAQRPRVLHIATHGFFLAEEPGPHAEQPWRPLEGNDLLAGFRGEDPMLRSGLVFAGANNPVSDPKDDDGYLTAQEAVHLDLQGTELVTLSACDAGRGDIRAGEGVYGLQRALIVAGARSMLISLWQVPDEATCEFMVRFYTSLKQGAGCYEALVAVQREFRHHDNVVWRHPYYWGAWQLIGDGRPIEGL